MFGFSFGELMVICVVALVAVGPQRLPGLLGTLAQWIRKARNLVHDMRAQSGIDDILRSEGLHGGLNELRSLMKVQHTQFFHPDVPARPSPISSDGTPAVDATTADDSAGDIPPPTLTPPVEDPYRDFDVDPTKEYPPEGADSYGALPDDLVDVVPFGPMTGSVYAPLGALDVAPTGAVDTSLDSTSAPSPAPLENASRENPLAGEATAAHDASGDPSQPAEPDAGRGSQTGFVTP